MVRVLPASGTAILNGDDPNVMWMRGRTLARVITFGLGESCDVSASELRLDWPHGTRFRLRAFGQEREVRIRLLGRHMVYPALAAIAVSLLEGFPIDETLSRLESLPPTPGRMEPVELPSGVFVLRDDFKSTLETMDSALDLLAQIPARRIVLLGDVSEPPWASETHLSGTGGAGCQDRIILRHHRQRLRGLSLGREAWRNAQFLHYRWGTKPSAGGGGACQTCATGRCGAHQRAERTNARSRASDPRGASCRLRHPLL